jgi:ligand-binding SRPBCC domain-containing protein
MMYINELRGRLGVVSGLSLSGKRTVTTFRLQTRIRLLRPRSDVFPFFADAYGLERLTPSWLRFTVTTPPPIAMRPGALIDYRLRIRGVPVRWRSEITAFEPPARFVDEQRRGPYRFWIHEHTFVEDGPEATLASDRVDYDVPGGALVHRLLVAGELRRIFRYRQEVLGQIFGAAEPFDPVVIERHATD